MSTLSFLLLFGCSFMSNSFVTLWTVAHQVLLLWDFPGKNTGVDCSPENTFITVNLLILVSLAIWIVWEFPKSSSPGSFWLNISFLNMSLSSSILVQAARRSQAICSRFCLEFFSAKYLNSSLARFCFPHNCR